MNSLPLRIASSISALLILGSVYFFGGSSGLLVLVLVANIGLSIEFSRMIFPGHSNLKTFFPILSLLLLVAVFAKRDEALTIFLCFDLLLNSFLLLQARKDVALSEVLRTQSLSLWGLIYCALLPFFVGRLLAFEHGDSWFFSLLFIVFAGDVTAFFFGLRWGNTKLLESVSPNKTIAGAWGGLIGSLASGVICAVFFVLPLSVLIPASLIAGGLAQSGDLFESLLKRVSRVKDSGNIMPGHGGFMDRLDGVLYAAPFFYLIVWLSIR